MVLLLFSERQEDSGALYTFLHTADQSVSSELKEMWQALLQKLYSLMVSYP